MPESMARQIEDAAKKLPKDFTFRRMGKNAHVEELLPGERTDVSVISTDSKDRDGEVVIAKGLDWKSYNRLVPFAHDYKQLPVGGCLWMKPTADGHGLKAKTQYATKPEDWGNSPWLPSAILHLMRQDPPICTGKSIGFIPTNVREATPAEKTLRPDWKDCPIIDQGIGLEYSIAPLPANQDSEMLAVSKCLADGAIDGALAKLLGASPEQAAEVVAEIVAKGAEVETMPPCPRCSTPAHVERKDADTFTCMKCMRDFKLMDASKVFEFIRRSTIVEAIKRQRDDAHRLALEEVRRQIQDGVDAILGRV